MKVLKRCMKQLDGISPTYCLNPQSAQKNGIIASLVMTAQVVPQTITTCLQIPVVTTKKMAKNKSRAKGLQRRNLGALKCLRSGISFGFYFYQWRVDFDSFAV
mmetsp:Transcript_19852/g.27900  ORF Transcript_19852/g.27900 Transcript_19852/m.27900 type:complete len:103 (-) Transcript_19852:9-317(-)